jgi:uncharacterized protein YecE (DUF72 family)
VSRTEIPYASTGSRTRTPVTCIEVLRFTRALFGLVQSPFLLAATEATFERVAREISERERGDREVSVRRRHNHWWMHEWRSPELERNYHICVRGSYLWTP